MHVAATRACRRRHALAVCLAQIDSIALQVREATEESRGRVPSYVEIFTGQRPEPREMARFTARPGRAAGQRVA